MAKRLLFGQTFSPLSPPRPPSPKSPRPFLSLVLVASLLPRKLLSFVTLLLKLVSIGYCKAKTATPAVL